MKAWPSFSGLTPAQLEAVGDKMGEHEYEGAELVGCTAKMLRRLLKGSDGEVLGAWRERGGMLGQG